MKTLKRAYSTEYGMCYHARIEDVLQANAFQKYRERINLIFTSPPFPLNTKKKYGNRQGDDYVNWLVEITTNLRNYLTQDGSLVIEVGNCWEPNEPIMSTLPLETLLAIKKNGNYNLCQQFIWFNTAKLPSPAQWVNVERIRVKDSFTSIWWMSKSSTPKANNRNILEEYSDAMKRLLKNKKYSHGPRPSEHNIGEQSFIQDNGGAIPSNVLIGSNTISHSKYLDYCKVKGLTPHPARMPRFVAEFFIKLLTEENDIVMDPFAGSNTTGEASELLKRRWISIEVEEQYIEGSRIKFHHES